MAARLPAHLEVAGLIRRVNGAGGFGTVLHKGERDGGTILVVAREPGSGPRLFERMPGLGDERPWTLVRSAESGAEQDFDAYLQRRASQDPDAWLIELDIAGAERLIGFAHGPD